ncbi:MAG TPA: HAD family hydrolase [Thermoanaerobaculia bacterium]|jgi:HAD superfamily hydrolase (TIGR01549 family)|nr:HAD family hydrolase [Thermoanaerobaculia bacterium]
MLKAISFDLWETLLTDTPELSRRQERLRLERMERVLAERGVGGTAGRTSDRTSVQIEQAYRALWHRCHELYWSRDEDIPCRVQIEHFLEELGLDAATFDEASLAALEEVYAGAAIDVLPSVVPGAHEVVAGLRARGYRIGLISNTGRTPGYALREILDRVGLASSIDAMVYSNEHGACKPRPSIFATLREALGVAYDEMMFVGDNLYVDVHGAQRLGITGVHFDPPSRGTAIAPHVDHGLEIVPDATIRDLRELMALVEALPAHA